MEPPAEEKHYTPQELEMETKMTDYFQMSCDLCMHQFDSWNDARTHYLDKHNVLKPFLRCCNRKFFLRSRIIEHITWHVDPTSFQYVELIAFLHQFFVFEWFKWILCVFPFHQLYEMPEKVPRKENVDRTHIAAFRGRETQFWVPSMP